MGICFSAATTVQVKDKGTILMDHLQIHDQVFVGINPNNQRPIYQSVYAFGHLEKDMPHEYLQIYTSPTITGKPLEMSAAHLIYLEGAQDPVRADSLQVGASLIHPTTSQGKKSIVRVSKITKVIRKGAYMPLTASGTIVVNGILASNYVSILENAPHVITKYHTVFSDHQLLHWWLAPYRVLCNNNLLVCQNNDKDENGISYWLVFGRFLATLANGWDVVSQMVGMVMVVLLLAAFMALEIWISIFGSGCLGLGAMVVLLLAAAFTTRRSKRVEKNKDL
jgi:Hint module